MATSLSDMDWTGSQWIGANNVQILEPEAGDGSHLEQRVDENGDWIFINRLTTTGSAYPTMRLRREVDVKPQLLQATVFICGLGQYELTIDGSRIGEDLLTPGWTKYTKTCLYDTYDVTAHLQSKGGSHAIGVLLGNGFYNLEDCPGRYNKFTQSFGSLKAIAQLRLQYTDGSTEIVHTNQYWTISPGPITVSHMYAGEDYDGRMEAKGWDSPGFNDSTWIAATVLDGPGGKLKASSDFAPPVRAIETLKTVNVNVLRQGVSVYDLGQNASMMPLLQVHGDSGSVVRMTPAELLNSDGSVDRSSCGGGIAYWQYTLAGDGNGETYFPKFFYQGFRYLQVERIGVQGGGLPTVDTLVGVVTHSSAEPVGEFSTSSDLFHKIYTLVRWAQRSNIVSVITDCPHREKLGWLEETHLNGPALRYNFNLNKLLAKTMNDMADSQHADGMVPTTAPEFFYMAGDFLDSPEWGSAFLMVPWQQYEFTGDISLLRDYYDGMAWYVQYLGSRAQDYIVSYGLSDWYDIAPGAPGKSKLTPKGVTATAFYYQNTLVLAKAATLLNRTEDAVKYQQQADQIRAAFNAKYFDAATNQYATGSQCANSMAMVMGIVEDVNRPAVLKNIVADIQEKGLTAGDVGYRYLLRALADGNRSDVIFSMTNQSEKPGYGYQLAKGATSLTEAWDADKWSSQNHFMLGQINEWFFHDLAGIQCHPEGPGFKKSIIKPAIVGDLTWVKASYNSVSGKIISEWKRTGNEISFMVTVPSSTTSTVFVPTTNPNSVVASSMEGVKFLNVEGGYAIYEVQSGIITFTSQM